MKKNAYMLLTVPFAWDEHETPYDYARYTSYGIRHILEKNGFKVLKQEKSSNYVETVFQLFIAYISQHVLPRNVIINSILSPFLIFPLTVIGTLLSKILPKNNNLYLDNLHSKVKCNQ